MESDEHEENSEESTKQVNIEIETVERSEEEINEGIEHLQKKITRPRRDI